MSEASSKKKDGGIWSWIAARIWRVRWGVREIYAADRQTYWSRALIYWNTYRPAWPIIAGCAFVIGVSLATSQGREALDYAVNLQGDPRSLMRVITSAVALLVFSITAHELALRVVNVHYYFSERASPLLRPRIRFAVIAGLVVPTAFALYFLARLGDAAAPEEGAGGLLGAVLLVDGFLEDNGQLIVGSVVIVQIVSALYDFVGPSWRGSLEGAARLAEKVVIFTLRLAWLTVFFGFAWYYVASPAIALVLNFPSLPSNSPLYGLVISGGVIVLAIALIALSHSRLSLRRYYSHTDQFVVFQRGHTQVSWTVLIGLMLTFLAAMIFPVEVSGAIGPIATALVCAMGLILVFTVGSVMTALGRGVPASLIVLLILIIAPMLNSTRLHDLQLVKAPAAKITAASVHARKWLDEHPDPSEPAIVVLAEGGGIRAAVHTASLLACLDRKDEKFFSKVYAFSGVSGGAVGIAAFLAARTDLAGQPAPPRDAPCRFDEAAEGGVEPVVATYLQADLFSPTLSTLLLRDFPFQSTVCALLPCRGIIEDRAGVFERAMDTAYWDSLPEKFQKERAKDRAAKPGDFGLRREFLDVVNKAAGNATPPVVIFNTFDAGLGLPAVVSNVSLDISALQNQAAQVKAATRAPSPRPLSFYNILEALPGCSVSLVTASHLSARFPLASPPGRIQAEKGSCGNQADAAFGPFVDGGYFDNSGAASAVRAVQALIGEDPNRRVMILHILFRPLPEEDPDQSPDPSRLPPLFEFSTPAQAVLKARMLHGDSPIEQLCRVSSGDQFDCLELNAWLASEEPQYRFAKGNDVFEWVRSPLQLVAGGLPTYDTTARAPPVKDNRDVELPLGWLVGDAGRTILARVSYHASDVLAAIKADPLPSPADSPAP